MALKVPSEFVHRLDGLGPALERAESDPQLVVLTHHPLGKLRLVAWISGGPPWKQDSFFERKMRKSLLLPEGQCFRSSRLHLGRAAHEHRRIERPVMVVREGVQLLGALHLTSTAPAGKPLGVWRTVASIRGNAIATGSMAMPSARSSSGSWCRTAAITRTSTASANKTTEMPR